VRDGDTIVALSSGAVPSGIAVIRLSGPASGAILRQMLGALPPPRQLRLCDIRFGAETLDRGLVAWMPGPRSFTGEDCAELHLHGSPAVVRAVLRQLTSQPGIRLADAGEFTRRAFEHGKLDLVEVEGLGDLILAETESQRQQAHARMNGGLTRQVEGWRFRLLDLRAEIEAQLDFSDEGDVAALPTGYRAELEALRLEHAKVLASLGQGRIVREGYRVVLAGPPNAGKSSLLNALSRSEAAIVSDEPGTTRDLKEVPLDLNGQLVLLIDSAGLRETASKAEALGIGRALGAMAEADLVLWLEAPDIESIEPPQLPSPLDGGGPRMVRIGTKADLGAVNDVALSVSATSGAGIERLLEWLYEASGAVGRNAAELLASRERDREALLVSEAALGRAAEHLDRPEVAAEDLRRASQALERLLGRMDAEAVLDRLFAAFCIGK